MRRLRPLLLLAGLLALWVWFEWREFEAEQPRIVERLDRKFSICGSSPSFACVHDGDSFRLGKRKIRIQHIDAPEIEGRCEKERALAVKSRARLRQLLNEGPFDMAAKSGRPTDQYGRELRILSRAGEDGERVLVGDRLVSEGLAHRYVDHKLDWC